MHPDRLFPAVTSEPFLDLFVDSSLRGEANYIGVVDASATARA
jgi:hypothetical protein